MSLGCDGHRHPFAMQLLLIEDDVTIARELQLRWRARGWVVRSCDTLAQADMAVSEAGADLVVLDLQLPDGDGLDWLHRFRQQDAQTPVLVLTARDQVANRVEGLKRGADDYLVKPFAPEELDARMEALQRRTQVVRSAGTQFGPLVLLPEQGRAFLHGQPMDLLPRELEVLSLLGRRSPRLVSKRVLIEALTERNLEVGDSAVEVYVSRLRRKLVDSGVTILTVRGFGYRLAVTGGPGTDGEPSA
jgi:DNA-binding response OmpR family regulator